jgi:hypothetical protein
MIIEPLRYKTGIQISTPLLFIFSETRDNVLIENILRVKINIVSNVKCKSNIWYINIISTFHKKSSYFLYHSVRIKSQLMLAVIFFMGYSKFEHKYQ